jgi:hypothetical protein
MNRDTTIGDLVSLLKREIAERQTLIAALEARLGPERAAPVAKVAKKSDVSVATAAAEILREKGRPMHGLDEILPALAERGIIVRNRNGFGTTMLRNPEIVRTAPGTYGLKSQDATAAE